MYRIFLLLYFFVLSDANSEEKFFKIDIENLEAKKLVSNIKGDKDRGRKVFISRKVNCLSCHEAPIEGQSFQGNFGPSLEGVGDRYSLEQLRLIIINSKIINPDTIMPAYYVDSNFPRTPKSYEGKKILTFQEVEDVIEYIYTFKKNEK